MDAKKLEKEMNSLMERATKGTTDFNEIMNRVVTKYNISQGLIMGWLNAYFDSHIQLDKLLPNETILVQISPNTPNTIISAMKAAFEEKGLGKRVFYAPDKDMILKIDKDILIQYIDFLQHMVNNM